MADPTREKQPRRAGGKPFAPGQSGNMSGRPAGARNKATIAIESLLEGQAAAIGQKAVELALEGDSMALKLCMERIAPLRRGRPVRFELPVMEDSGDLVKSLGGVLRAVASGDLTPDEGSTVAGIMNAKRLAIETVEIEQRLVALERSARGNSR